MGFFDFFDRKKKRADFSNVESGSSSTAADPTPPPIPEAVVEHTEEREFLEAEPEPQPMVYTVRRGDTLWDIAAEHLGEGRRWKEIEKANEDVIDNPDMIYPGMTLVIPQQYQEQTQDQGGLV